VSQSQVISLGSLPGITNPATVAYMTEAIGVDPLTEERSPLWLCDEPECTRATEPGTPDAEDWLPTEEAHFCPKHANLRFGGK